eukprot:gene20195-22172_t
MFIIEAGVGLNFPSIFVLSNLQDDLVPAWVPLKWMAKLRNLENHQVKSHKHYLIICCINEKGGHFNTHGQEKEKETAETVAFLYDALELPMKA